MPIQTWLIYMLPHKSMPLLPCKYICPATAGAYAGCPLVPRMNLECEWEMSILLSDAIVGGSKCIYPCYPATIWPYIIWGIYAPGTPHTMNLNLDCDRCNEYIVRRRDCRGAGLTADMCASQPASRGRDYYHLVNTCKQSNTPLSHPTQQLANPPCHIPSLMICMF